MGTVPDSLFIPKAQVVNAGDFGNGGATLYTSANEAVFDLGVEDEGEIEMAEYRLVAVRKFKLSLEEIG